MLRQLRRVSRASCGAFSECLGELIMGQFVCLKVDIHNFHSPPIGVGQCLQPLIAICAGRDAGYVECN